MCRRCPQARRLAAEILPPSLTVGARPDRAVGLTARLEVLPPRLRPMVGGGSLGPRRGRLRANVSGSASILGRRLRMLSLLHLPWPHGTSGRPSWAIALTCGKLLNIHVRMTHTTSLAGYNLHFYRAHFQIKKRTHADDTHAYHPCLSSRHRALFYIMSTSFASAGIMRLSGKKQKGVYLLRPNAHGSDQGQGRRLNLEFIRTSITTSGIGA